MSRADDGEVAVVEGREVGGAEPLAGGNDLGIDDPELEIGVLAEQLVDSRPVVGLDRLDQQLACSQRAGKRLFSVSISHHTGRSDRS